MLARMQEIYTTIPPFKCAAIPRSERRDKWLQWKRGFLSVAATCGEDNKTKLKHMLLRCGGFELQNVFYQIDGADVDEKDDGSVDPYKVL